MILKIYKTVDCTTANISVRNDSERKRGLLFNQKGFYMSYTKIFKFDKQGNSKSVSEVKNSWRGCMAIWEIMGNKYCGHGASMFDIEKMRQIWKLVDNPGVSVAERIVLHTTLDKCLVKSENLDKVISAFREFEGDTSLSEQADILQELLNDDDCIAIGWHQNSMSCEQWYDYNCITDTEHYWLFDELN